MKLEILALQVNKKILILIEMLKPTCFHIISKPKMTLKDLRTILDILWKRIKKRLLINSNSNIIQIQELFWHYIKNG